MCISRLELAVTRGKLELATRDLADATAQVHHSRSSQALLSDTLVMVQDKAAVIEQTMLVAAQQAATAHQHNAVLEEALGRAQELLASGVACLESVTGQLHDTKTRLALLYSEAASRTSELLYRLQESAAREAELVQQVEADQVAQAAGQRALAGRQAAEEELRQTQQQIADLTTLLKESRSQNKALKGLLDEYEDEREGMEEEVVRRRAHAEVSQLARHPCCCCCCCCYVYVIYRDWGLALPRMPSCCNCRSSW